MSAPRRLDQLLANLGYCSRREARDFLRATLVTVNGQPARDPSAKVAASAVRVAGESLDHPDGLLVMLHKPLGLTCSHDPREAPLIYDALPPRWRERTPVVTTIGRLDKETSGLLLVTDHAELVHRLTSPKHKVPKTYVAEVDRDLPPDLAALFAAGTLRLDGEDTPCAPAELRPLSPRRAELVLTEGKYHQVRMFAAACGATVTALHRTHFGRLTLPADLAPGQWRSVHADEI